MKKYQKLVLAVSIFICLQYAFSVLFHLHVFIDLLSYSPWMESLYAFIAGLCGFLNILLYRKDDE